MTVQELRDALTSLIEIYPKHASRPVLFGEPWKNVADDFSDIRDLVIDQIFDSDGNEATVLILSGKDFEGLSPDRE